MSNYEAKEGVEIEFSDFWYDLTNGYIKPEEILVNQEDINEVKNAISVIKKLEDLCEEVGVVM